MKELVRNMVVKATRSQKTKKSLQGAHIVRKEMKWGQHTLSLETGRIARQANGAVLVTYGDTVVLCTVVAAPESDPSANFLPLSVHYAEKTFAAGKIPGGFLKRESKPSEKEVLVSRLIDRPIRPLFPDNFFNEVQVLCTVLSYDKTNEPDIVAMVGASAALSISGVPFQGPIAGARVGYCQGKYVLNPSLETVAGSAMDLVVAGTKNGVLMVESEIAELADDVVLEGVMFGHKAVQPVINMIQEFVEEAGKPRWETNSDDVFEEFKANILNKFRDDISDAFFVKGKMERIKALDSVFDNVKQAFLSDDDQIHVLTRAFKASKEDVLRKHVLDKRRIDGRGLKDVRSITCETKILPVVHGSSLFTRGETQALVVTTLGSNDDAQFMDGLDGEYKESFMLHYNFPSYSVGEVRRVGPPGRREIGHGKLAWRALRPVLPLSKDFPYTLRVVSEVTESNGSSSMATVCGSSLSLMDAGVPLERPVSGIAMGLVKEGKSYAVLSDISADEDSLGDMDFKVAGTEQGLTALQMDIKITSITTSIMKAALAQAREGRLLILKAMIKELESPRDLSETAPRVKEMKIAKEKIKDVIGPGGKVIREICERTGAKIDVEDNGVLRVFAPNLDQLNDALSTIKDLTFEPQVGDIFDGQVVSIVDFGAFVNFKGQDGLVHISELAPKKVNKVTDIVSKGDRVRVKVIGLDRGKVKLSIKQVHQD